MALLLTCFTTSTIEIVPGSITAIALATRLGEATASVLVIAAASIYTIGPLGLIVLILSSRELLYLSSFLSSYCYSYYRP